MGHSYWQLASVMIKIAMKNLNIIIADVALLKAFIHFVAKGTFSVAL